MQPAPRPIRSTSETKCSQRPPSHDDTDVVGWRRVSCWWRRCALRPSSPSAAPNPRRRPIATNKPSTPAAGDHLHCHTERRTRCWRRSSTPQVDLACSSLSTGSPSRSASDATEPPSPQLLKRDCCRAPPRSSHRAASAIIGAPPPRARETMIKQVNAGNFR